MAKQFEVNPADKFFSSASRGNTPASTGTKTPPKGYKMNPEFLETKSKKLQCLVKPSDFEALKKKAQELNTSVNALVNEAIEAFLMK